MVHDLCRDVSADLASRYQGSRKMTALCHDGGDADDVLDD